MAILLTAIGIELVVILVLGIINKDIHDDTSFLDDCF